MFLYPDPTLRIGKISDFFPEIKAKTILKHFKPPRLDGL